MKIEGFVRKFQICLKRILIWLITILGSVPTKNWKAMSTDGSLQSEGLWIILGPNLCGFRKAMACSEHIFGVSYQRLLCVQDNCVSFCHGSSVAQARRLI